MNTERYVSPLSERYASKEMQYIFSQDKKFKTWRKLWIALAETERELGLSLNEEQVAELKAHAEDINYDVAREREKEVRHDVMSHVYAYGVQCPKAKGIIHLGATSCYVGDNTDIIVMTEGLQLIHCKLINVIQKLAEFAKEYTYHIEEIAAGQSVEISPVKIQLKTEFLFSLTEKMVAMIQVELFCGEEKIYSDSDEVELLAFDQWSGLLFMPEIISAFVTPNHPKIAEVIRVGKSYITTLRPVTK